MNKEKFNLWYMIILMVAGLIFFFLRVKSTTFGYIGLGLISVGFTIGIFETLRSDKK